MSHIHIYAPPVARARRIMHCRTCRKSCRVVQTLGFDLNVLQCCGCGDDPYASPTRFKKITSARREKIRKAREQWQAALSFAAAMKLSTQQILEMW